MEIEKTINKGSTYISITGKMDLSDAHLLKHSLNVLKKSPVIIDFSKVPYIGSVCIGMLVAAKKTYPDIEFIFFNCNEMVRKNLNTVGVDRLFIFR